MIKKVDKIIAIFCIAVIIMSAFAGIVSGADSTSNTSSYGSLKIKITDKTTGKGLKAGFKIYFTPETGSAGWVNSGNTIYTDKSTGIKELSVSYGRYIVYEVEAPEGYDLSEQDGYQSNNNRVYIKTVTISSDNKTADVICTNKTNTNNNNNNSNTNNSEEAEEEEEEEEETGNLSGPSAFTSQKQIGSTIWAARNDSQRNEKNYSKVRLKIGEPKYNTYCIDHSVNMEVKKYTVKAYANISGNTAKGYTSANDTGKTKSGNENLVLAYILNKEGLENGWGGGGIKQYAVWRYLGTWISNIGKEIGIGNAWNHAFNKNKNYNASDYNNATNLMNEAKNWAENNVNNSIRNIGNNTVEMISETTAGPFKVEYTGTIASITVRENPNDKDYINPEYITFSTDSEGKNQKDASEIESGEEFYVHCSNSSIKMGEVRVNMKPNESISAQLWFLSSTSNSQDIMKVNTYSSKSTPRVKINIVEKTKKIKLIKQDTSGKRLVAGFKIYFKPSSGNSGWINGGNTIYTNSNGEKIINNLSDGEYIIYEVEPPSEEYKLEDQDYQYVKKDYITGLYIGQVTLSNENAEAEIKCINKKTETPSTPTPPPTPTSKKGSLSIHKYDGNTQLTAGFKIKTDNGWLRGNNGSYTYNNTESNAEIYYTNSPVGYKTLTDLELGTYTVYEVTPPSGYNLQDQTGYENGKVYVDRKTLTESQTSITFEKENTKPEIPTGSLQIHKYDGNTQLTAGFRIKTNNGWLKGSNGSYTYNNTESNAEIYYTNSPTGYKTLTDLELGTYTVYEVTPPSGYNLQDQTGYENGKVYVDRKTLTESQTSITFEKENTKPEIPTGSLQIHKYDGNTQLTAGFRIKTNNGWLKGSNGSYTYNNTESNAEIYYTNSPTGYKTLTDLELGTYTVYEVTPPSGYNLEDQTGYENGKVYVDSKTLTESQTEITFNKENIKIVKGNITIRKYDGNTKLRAGFKIKTTTGWLVGNNGSYSYNNSETNATKYYTDSSTGTITINNLELGSYTVYEVEAPEGYDITKQSGYSNGKIELETKTLTENATDINFSIENKKLVNVEGFVWNENPNGKANEYNDVFNRGTLDKLISGITVRLYGNSGFISETTTQNGYYKFSNIDNNSLTNGYVEFIYDNTKYVTCHTLVGNNNAINSKAKELEMQAGKLEDDNLTGTAGANPGIAVTEQGKLTTYGYDSKTYSYSNINLGLKQKAVSQHSITETLEYIKVKMKGYTYTYKYGEDPVTMSTYVPAVSEQNSKATFTAKIYPSDVAYNVINSTATDKLEIYVVYSMGVTNTTTTNIDDIYVEQKLYLTSLTNTFDTERYELSTEANGNNDNENNQFKLWNIQANKATYNLNNANSVYKDGITNNETKTAYIQFRIKDNAVQKMLNRTLSVEDIENAPTIAEATGFHEYLRQDQLWKESSARKYNGAKGNASSPYYLHKSTTKSAKSSDLYLKLTLGKTRTVSGTVFEDSVINNDLKLGDGVLNDNENKIKNVTVELLNADRNTVTSLYKVNEQGAIIYQEGSNLPKAITTSDQNGVYSFEGIVPGYYYIRFTYGDGTQKIVSAGEEKSLTSNDYKSTTINTAENGAGNIIKDELERAIGSQEAINNANWYESLNNQYSVAVDDLNMREKMDSYVYSSGKDENGNTKTIASDKDGNIIGQFPMNVYSYSPMMGIAIEKNVDYNDDSDEMSVFGKFSFGIIEAPKTIIGVDISISNVSITNQVGSTIISENPASSRSKYLTSLEQNEFGKSKYAKTEIDMESIYGSDLKADYELTVKNDSEKDYIEENDAEKGYYYKYGIITSSAKEKIVNIESVLNTIDSKYNIDSINKKIKVSDTKEVTIDKSDSNAINISGWGNLERGSILSIGYGVTGLLTRDDDTGYINKAAVSAISLDKLTTLNSNFIWPGSDAENEARITFTPPTGKDKRNIYIASSIIVLVALCTVIVLLKKKLL